MKNRGLAALIVALVLMLFVDPTFAEEAKEPKAENDKKPEMVHKPYRTPTAWCSLYSKLMYLTGEFSGSDRADRFVREGLKLGASCNYNNNSRLTLGVGTEFYLGKFHLNHAEDGLQASVSYLEAGFKEWLSATLDLHPIKIVAIAGLERTNSSGFTVNSLQVDFGGGWYNFKKFAEEHLSSSGELEIWEAGLNVEFPFRRKFSLTFGGLWQRYEVTVRVRLDAEGKRVLEALEYDVSKVERDFKRSRNFFYLTPGAKWCGEKLCASLVVPWGVFQADKWSWGLALGAELQF